MTDSTSTERRKLHALQGLRGIAAMLVLVDHIILALSGRNIIAKVPYDHFAWLIGNIGVYTFFIISGFIMEYTTRNDFGNQKSKAFLEKD